MNLETSRLILREFLHTDFEDYYAYIMDTHLRQALGLGNVFDEPSALENFNWLMEKLGFQHWGIENFNGIELTAAVRIL